MPLQPTPCVFMICDTSNTRKKNSKSKSKKFQKKFQKKNGLRALAPHRNRMRFQDTSLSACLVVLISLASVLPIILLQCVAVCCRALQCGVVHCSVLQCVAVCCSGRVSANEPAHDHQIAAIPTAAGPTYVPCSAVVASAAPSAIAPQLWLYHFLADSRPRNMNLPPPTPPPLPSSLPCLVHWGGVGGQL